MLTPSYVYRVRIRSFALITITICHRIADIGCRRECDISVNYNEILIWTCDVRHHGTSVLKMHMLNM